MSSTIGRAALGIMQDIPTSVDYDSSSRGGKDGTHFDDGGEKRGTKLTESALNYISQGSDEYAINSYSIDTSSRVSPNTSGSPGSPTRIIDLSRIGKSGGGMTGSSSEGQFEQSARVDSRGSRRRAQNVAESKANDYDGIDFTKDYKEGEEEEVKSLRKLKLERELAELESEIERKRAVIDRNEEETERAYSRIAQAKDDESSSLYHKRQADLKRQAALARTQVDRDKEIQQGSDFAVVNSIQKETGNSSSSNGGGSVTSDERERLEREKVELQEKLELMEMQNKLLASRVERTETRAQEMINEEAQKRQALELEQENAKQALELERAQKTLALSQLEGAQRTQLDAEVEAKEKLERERAELVAKLQAMELSEAEAQQTLLAEKAEREKLARTLEHESKMRAEAEATHQKTSEILEMERKQALDAIATLEEDKKKLLQEQEMRQKAIALEKEELRASVKRMEEEKKSLYDKVAETERKAAEEIQQLELHKVEYEISIKRLEQEKGSLDEKMRDVEKQSEMVTEAMAEQLNKEREKLLLDMKKLEDEKTTLATSLESTTAKSKEASELMEQRLKKEKDELQRALEAMEVEKKEMADHLTKSIEESKQKSKDIEDKTAEELHSLKAAIAKAETEKQEIALKLEESATKSKMDDTNESAAKVREQEYEKEQMELKANMAKMAAEKEQMQQQLKAIEAATKLEKEKELQRSQREKEELKAAVQKMKDELKREKESAAAAIAAANASVASNAAVSAVTDQAPSPEHTCSRSEMEEDENTMKQLKPSKSLYDMFQDEGPEDTGPKLPRTLSKALLNEPIPHTIEAIAEGDETNEENIFGVEDGSDWGSVGSRGSRSSVVLGVNGKKKASPSDKKVKKEPKPEKQADPFDDLPAPHAAAAGGDVARLKMLGRLEASLLSSFDAAHRCPLFYAVAYGQLKISEYLVEKCPEMVDAVDSHGDTPLHAAASGGSVECMELLLSTKSKMAKDQGRQGHGDSSNSVHSDTGNDYHDNAKYGDIANPRNSMSMTPCHLARSMDVIEVLYNYGADLSAQDCNGRSPLFVACAMNREPCADFIINCLDREGKTDEIYDKDRRGDTALHAAACNGAVDCLLLLLQYGVDPTVGNNKSLKAIDLAARNNHVRCRDVLAEYHLHFCTSSEFDSVLFLATLQGHRRVKEEESEKKSRDGGLAADNESSYNIIKKKSFSSKDSGALGGGDVPKGLKHVQSMFSLKTQKSLRVQRWGDWIAYEDQQTSHIYWYNHSKGCGQWEKPEEVAQMQLDAALNNGADGSAGVIASSPSPGSPFPTLSPKKSMRLRKHGDWIEYITETSQTFFYNEKNGEFQWTAPPGVVPRSASKADTTPIPATHSITPAKSKREQQGTPEHNLLTSQPEAGVFTPQMSTEKTDDGPVHTDWQPYKDPESGNIFWYNTVTQVSQWECPLENVELVSQDAVPTPRKGGGDDDEDEAVEVLNDEDLGI